jgi:hypothetical protein
MAPKRRPFSWHQVCAILSPIRRQHAPGSDGGARSHGIKTAPTSFHQSCTILPPDRHHYFWRHGGTRTHGANAAPILFAPSLRHPPPCEAPFFSGATVAAEIMAPQWRPFLLHQVCAILPPKEAPIWWLHRGTHKGWHTEKAPTIAPSLRQVCAYSVPKGRKPIGAHRSAPELTAPRWHPFHFHQSCTILSPDRRHYFRRHGGARTHGARTAPILFCTKFAPCCHHERRHFSWRHGGGRNPGA